MKVRSRRTTGGPPVWISTKRLGCVVWLIEVVAEPAPATVSAPPLVSTSITPASVYCAAGSEIVSGSLAPAGHSPATPPDGVFVVAAVTASRNEHWPSLPDTTSPAVLTVIDAAAAEFGAAA